MCGTDGYDMTLALNPNTTNQPVVTSKVKRCPCNTDFADKTYVSL